MSQPNQHRLHRHTAAPLPPPPSQPQASLARDSQAVPLQGLRKQHSWSPDIYRDEAWLRRKGRFNKNKRSKSVTDEDLDELKACIELGFGFDSPEPDADADHRRLADTLPALELYYAVNKNYNDSVSKSTVSDCESPSPLGSPHTFFSPGENDPQTVKTRLRQWAQVVACSVRQFSSS